MDWWRKEETSVNSTRACKWENTLQPTSCTLLLRACISSARVLRGWHRWQRWCWWWWWGSLLVNKKFDIKTKWNLQIQKLVIQNDETLKGYSFQGTSITLWTTSRIFLTLITQPSSSWCAQFNGWHIYGIICLSDTHLYAIYYLKHIAAKFISRFLSWLQQISYQMRNGLDSFTMSKLKTVTGYLRFFFVWEKAIIK